MALNILLIGNGGREHAIAVALAKAPSVASIHVAPGNGGTKSVEKTINVDIQQDNFPQLSKYAVNNNISFVVCGPEIPLVDGISDFFKKSIALYQLIVLVGIPCFGPSKLAARIEGSKAFSKDFMKKHHIPTADYKNFTSFEEAKAYLPKDPTTCVIKASGLAAGKGVILPETYTEAVTALEQIMVQNVFGSAGGEVVIEERLSGQEVSILAFSDGYSFVAMPAAQDHKRALDGDLGLNTGGMGAYAPAPVFTDAIREEVERKVLRPSIDGLRRDGYPFVGILYVGIMLTPTGPKVLEYNCRFGDPETQVLLPLLSDDCDLAQIMLACCEGRLDSVAVHFKKEIAATVVLASKGYPGPYPKGVAIKFSGPMVDGTTVFHAGTTHSNDGKLVTSGGRVIAVTGVSKTLEEALKKAYESVSLIEFDGKQFRKDIGHRALTLSKQQKGATYADAGVSIDDGNLLVEKIKPIVKATRRLGADADLGGFGGLFDLKACGFKDAVLVSGTDGVGTKLIIAQTVGKHDTIGIDLVAMSVNDVLVQGAEPLFFLDYFACSKLEVDVAKDVVKGIAQGCIDSNCALIGGETAEMPGIYSPGEYDLAGFVVGAVERSQILPTMSLINPTDVILGLPSSGIHSNGFSLVRHVIKNANLDYASPSPFSSNQSLGEALLTPTRIYVKGCLPAIKSGKIKSMAHITGGGFTDNIPRAILSDRGVVIDAASYPLLPVFKWLKKVGGIEAAELARTFNCGIGMILIVSRENVKEVVRLLKEDGGEKDVYEIGYVTERDPMSKEEAVKILNTNCWDL